MTLPAFQNFVQFEQANLHVTNTQMIGANDFVSWLM